MYVTNQDDWCGIYIDGKLEYQDHRIDFVQGMNILQTFGIKSLEIEEKVVDEGWLMEEGGLPEKIEDVVWAK